MCIDGEWLRHTIQPQEHRGHIGGVKLQTSCNPHAPWRSRRRRGELLEPGHEPLTWFEPIVQSKVFRDLVPWVVIRVVKSGLELTRDPARAGQA